MQYPIISCTGFRRAASCALRLALHGTGLVLIRPEECTTAQLKFKAESETRAA